MYGAHVLLACLGQMHVKLPVPPDCTAEYQLESIAVVQRLQLNLLCLGVSREEGVGCPTALGMLICANYTD